MDKENESKHDCNPVSDEEIKNVSQGAASSHDGESSRSPLVPETNKLRSKLVEQNSQMEECSKPLPVPKMQTPEGAVWIPNLETSSTPQPSGKIPELAEDLLREEGPSIPNDIPNEPPAANSVGSSTNPANLRTCGRAYYDNRDSKHVCLTCGRHFARQAGLTQHKNAHHSGPMKYVCTICGKRFKQKNKFKTHQLVHEEGRNKLQCKICGSNEYCQETDLKRHHRLWHSENPIVCQFCGRQFSRTDHKRAHEEQACKNRPKRRTQR